MIELRSIAPLSAPVPVLNSLPQSSFTALLNDATNTMPTEAAPESAQNPMPIINSHAPSESLALTSTQILPRATADMAPLAETDIPAALPAPSKVTSPELATHTKTAFPTRTRHKSSESDAASQAETLQATPSAIATEAPITQGGPLAAPIAPAPSQQSLAQTTRSNSSNMPGLSPGLRTTDSPKITAARDRAIAETENGNGDQPFDVAAASVSRAVHSTEPSRTRSVAAKPHDTPSKFSVDIASAPLPANRAPNDAMQPSPSVLFQQQPMQASAATAGVSPAVDLPQLNLAADAGWIDTLARDIAISAAGDGRLNFRLLPEKLGQLDIEMTHRDGNIDIAMQASSDGAASIIIAEQLRLVEELRQSGLKVGNFDLSGGQNGGSTRQQQASPSSPPNPSHQQISTPQKPRQSHKRSDRFA
jgi:flagellar hook-length control protein FliK